MGGRWFPCRSQSHRSAAALVVVVVVDYLLFDLLLLLLLLSLVVVMMMILEFVGVSLLAVGICVQFGPDGHPDHSHDTRRACCRTFP